MKYIDAEALKKVMCADCDNKHFCAERPACETVQQIDAQPAADVDYERGFIEGYTKAESDIFHGGKYAPVKHGRWIKLFETEDDITARCSECGIVFTLGKGRNPNYCGTCGAKMDEVEK